jgi:hypothetical protein
MIPISSNVMYRSLLHTMSLNIEARHQDAYAQRAKRIAVNLVSYDTTGTATKASIPHSPIFIKLLSHLSKHGSRSNIPNTATILHCILDHHSDFKPLRSSALLLMIYPVIDRLLCLIESEVVLMCLCWIIRGVCDVLGQGYNVLIFHICGIFHIFR